MLSRRRIVVRLASSFMNFCATSERGSVASSRDRFLPRDFSSRGSVRARWKKERRGGERAELGGR